MKKIDIITIFPKQVSVFISEGIFRIAVERGIELAVHDLRDWTEDRHNTVDDRPFGGGPGMVMKVEPIFKAVSDLKGQKTHTVLTSPRGKQLTSAVAKRLAKQDHLILICGHYEGVDERVRQKISDEDISIGRYILSGGELPALVITDALLRQVPDILGNPESLAEESFEGNIEKEYPQYTRPEEFNGWKVPKVLLSGNHKEIERWRRRNSNL